MQKMKKEIIDKNFDKTKKNLEKNKFERKYFY